MLEDYVMQCPDIFVSATVEKSFALGMCCCFLFFIVIGVCFGVGEFVLILIDRKRNSPPRGEDKNSN